MTIDFTDPPEDFPAIGTVESPSAFYDGEDLFLSYEIAPVAGGGTAILRFAKVIDFRVLPLNVDGLSRAVHPTRPWRFTEVTGAARTAAWPTLSPRFWTISFTDETVEVLFASVELLVQTETAASPRDALARILAR